MTILITGANGFLGKNILYEIKKYSLNELVLTPTSKEFNLLDINSVNEYFKTFKPSKVLHMAALCGGILANQNNKFNYIHLNNKMTVNLFDAMTKYPPRYLYTLGSVCAYGKNTPIPFKEDDLFLQNPDESNENYGHYKRILFITHKAFLETYNIKGCHFIPVNMMGKYDHFNDQNSHVIPALIYKIYKAKQKNDSSIFCFGSGNCSREFIMASDVSEALLQALQINFHSDLPINLGTGKSISIFDLAHLIAKLMNYKGEIIFTGEVSDGQPKRQLDVSRAKELLGFEAKTDLETGLKQTIQWYEEMK